MDLQHRPPVGNEKSWLLDDICVGWSGKARRSDAGVEPRPVRVITRDHRVFFGPTVVLIPCLRWELPGKGVVTESGHFHAGNRTRNARRCFRPSAPVGDACGENRDRSALKSFRVWRFQRDSNRRSLSEIRRPAHWTVGV